MTDIRLQLENESITLNLNELLDTPAGMQALAGLTGLGLPPVDVQWLEGAGDGAKARGVRARQRDIDLPIFFSAADRAGLKTMVANLSKVLAGRATLRLIDPDTDDWTIDVYRVGGGDFTYGEDTDGNSYMFLTVTLRSESPYWTRVTPISVTQTNTGIGPTMTLSNPGSASAYPVWTINGPGIDFKAVSPSGELLHFADYIETGSTITIDAMSGSVTDENGTNRYSGLASAPRFFRLDPGATVVSIEFDRTSQKFIDSQAAGRTNHVLNPALTNNASNWSLATGANGPAYDAAAKRIKLYALTAANTYASPYNRVSNTVTGLTPGATYQVSAVLSSTTYGSDATPMKMYATGSSGQVLGTVNVGSGASGTFTFNITPDADTVTIQVHGAWRSAAGQYTQYTGSVDNLYVGEPGDYFDGSTADTAEFSYSWLGTADASKSKAVSATVDTSSAGVACTFNPRDWMVV